MTTIKITLEDCAKCNIRYWWDEDQEKGPSEYGKGYFEGFSKFEGFIQDYLSRTECLIRKAIEESEFNGNSKFEFTIGSWDEKTN